MEQFDAGHLLAALGHLDAITDQHQPVIDPQRIGEQSQHHLRPQRGHRIKVDAGTVEVIEQLVIEPRL